MDLLGSILNSMDKPPENNEEQKKLIKIQKEQIENQRTREKEELLKFRKFVDDRFDRFIKNDKRRFLEFQPLDKVHRSIIHDTAEIAGFLALSFGQEGVDRYTVVYKKEFAPTEDEILARRNGEQWTEEIAKEYAQNRKDQKQKLLEEKAHKPVEVIPNTNYKDKYVHLIGQEAALEAARKTESNKTYGFVPSENKKDLRSIEQTMADIQAKKRQKLSHGSGDVGKLTDIVEK